eukprot:scaffold784_cov399-Prasinococcus_capsulatus_cf.AAC.9
MTGEGRCSSSATRSSMKLDKGLASASARVGYKTTAPPRACLSPSQRLVGVLVTGELRRWGGRDSARNGAVRCGARTALACASSRRQL